MTKRWVLRSRRFLTQKVLHTNDTPHQIAIGTSISVFVALLPLIGIQMLLAIALTAIFRGNKAVCIPAVWITNPVTVGPIYWTCLQVGGLIVGGNTDTGEQIAQLVAVAQESSMLSPIFWVDLMKVLMTLGVELWVGCAIVAIVGGIISYFVAHWAVRAYRERRRLKMLKRSLFRSRLARRQRHDPAT